MRRFFALLSLVCSLAIAAPAFAVWPMPQYSSYPCDAAASPASNCSSQGGDRRIHTQFKLSDRSVTASNSCTPLSGPNGGFCDGPNCFSLAGFCRQPSILGSPTARIVHIGAQAYLLFDIEYDFPNNYCQLSPSGDVAEWPIVFNGFHLNRLNVYAGFDTANFPLASSMAVFEHGRWMPMIPIGCNAGVYTVEVINHCELHQHDVRTINVTVGENDPLNACTDNGCSCPVPGVTGAGSTMAPKTPGEPVNAGSGDVSALIPLFTIAQMPLSLSMSLSYHSGLPANASLVQWPMGIGWTHTFNQILRPVDPQSLDLYRRLGNGDEIYYSRSSTTATTWRASGPGEARGSVTSEGTQLVVHDLDGSATAFDAATGAWVSTTDRWGAAIRGTYSGGQLVTVTDSVGRQVQLAYSGGTLSQITLPDGQTWRFTYSGSELTKVFDPGHSGTTAWRSFEYQTDTRGTPRLLTAVRDETGALLDGHTYDAQERGITSFSAGGSDQVSVSFGANGQSVVTHEIDAGVSQVANFSFIYQRGRYLPLQVIGNCTTCGGESDTQSFTYDGSNRILTRTDGRGHITKFDYDANGNVVRRIDAFGTPAQRTATFEYDDPLEPSLVTKVTESSVAKAGSQKSETHVWSNNGTTLTETRTGYLRASDTAPVTYTTVTTYDAKHRVVSFDGPRTDVSDVTTTTYWPDDDANGNRRGRARQVTDASGLITVYDDYDVFGTPRLVTDPNGVQTVRQTDGRGRTYSRTVKAVSGDARESSDYTTTATFDGRDRLVMMTYPRGNAVAYVYQPGTHRQTDTVRLDASGNEVERHHVTYNIAGEKIREEDQQCASPAATCGNWVTKSSTQITFDVHDRPVRKTYADGASVEYTYDAEGLLRTVRDENHATANFAYGYDELDRVTSITQTLGGSNVNTSYQYDLDNNIVRLTDPNGNVTAWTYDDFGRQQSETSPVTGMTTFTYNAAGQVVTRTDANGAVTTTSYDASGRVLTTTATRDGNSETVTRTYDGATAGSYGKGRLASMTDPTGSIAFAYDRRGNLRSQQQTIQGNAYSMAFGYDANGNRNAITYPSGRVVDYTFDFADRPLSAASGATTYVSSAAYLPFGPRTSLAFGNGTSAAMTYDARYRMTENRLNGPTGLVAGYGYGYDNVGNVTAVNDLVSSAYSRAFGYDDLYRLTSASGGSALWGNATFSYDPLGNVTALSIGSRNATFTYSGTTPRLASVTENGETRAIQYDAAGNEIATGTSTFAWTPRNQLGSGDGLTYLYDGRGVRTVTSVSTAIGTFNGTVVAAATNAPVAGATVTIDGTLNSTTTDSAGNFSLNQIAGSYTLTVAKSGFVPETTTAFTLGAGATVSVGTVKLTVAPSTISGTVMSSLGGALAGATVALNNGVTASTDASGQFSIRQPAGTYSVTISAPGYESASFPSFTTSPGENHSLGTVTLAAHPAILSGTVVSSTGGALAGATVTANGNTQQNAALALAAKAAVSQSTTTDAAGAFSLTLPAGTYTLSVTKSGFATTQTSALSIGPGTTSAIGTIAVDPLGTISGTVVAQATNQPIANANIAIVGSLNNTTTDASGHFTIQQPPGSYAIQVTATGFATLTTDFFSLAAGGTHDAGTLKLAPVALSVYVGYADDLRPSANFPVPWNGSPDVVYIGTASPLDAGAIRLDNSTDAPMPIDSVTVDLGRPGPTFNLWGSFSVPPHGSVILTQTELFNFDTSDYPIVACGATPVQGDPRVPRVVVRQNGNATTYYDTGHILDTGGFDSACRQNESLQWRLIGTTGVQSNGDFLLSPPTGHATLGTQYTVTATATDANGQPLRNVTVTFKVIAGPNLNRTGTAVTDTNGVATFSYTGSVAGTDTLQATIANASGGSLQSNPVTVTWLAFSNLEVFVGYADNLRPAPAFPNPWSGSPNVVYIGAGGNHIDAGAVRFDNTGDTDIRVDRVVVDLQRPGPTWNLWGSFTIPAHKSVIITQTDPNVENFDTSDFPITGCHGTISPTDPRIPKITVTVGGSSASYLDTSHILDTFGYDVACDGRNESLQWRPIGSSSVTDNGNLRLQPDVATIAVGGTHTVIAIATDAGFEPIPNVAIDFRVISGPNVGKTGRVTTNDSGAATFSYSSTATGLDTIRASITNASGGVLNSNDVKATWVATANLTLAPPSATLTVGSIHNATVTVRDGAGAALANMVVTFRIVTGPNAGRTAQGITNAQGQAVFTYVSSVPGIDSLIATIVGAGGSLVQSNQVTVEWVAPISIALAPSTATTAVGATYTATATVLNGGSPAANTAVSFQVLAGPNAGRTGNATTNSAGAATFSYTSATTGTDVVQASAGSATSNQVLSKWIAVPAVVTFTGPFAADYNDATTFSAKLIDGSTGAPIANQTLAFALGSQTASGVTNASGIAQAVITPLGIPGATPMTVTFTATGAYSGSTASAFVSVVRDETAIRYTANPVIANGVTQTVSATLTDPDGDAPIAGKLITFTIGSVSVSATTGSDGVATTTITIPASLGTGPIRMSVVFAGDTYYVPAETSVPVILYTPSSFVIWGGNAIPPRVGDRVQFWGAQWEKQVVSGEYDKQADFKGFATLANPPLAQICQADARLSGSPQLTAGCWASKPGQSNPPATLDRYIGIIVSTAIAKDKNDVIGNIAATVVVRVDNGYDNDPGKAGTGVITAVIVDGSHLFPAGANAALQALLQRRLLDGGDSRYFFRHLEKPRRTAAAQVASLVLPAMADAAELEPWNELLFASRPLQIAPLTVGAGSRRYSLYSPELALLAETSLVAGNGAPQIAYEYVWFDGKPVAQIDSGVTTHWTFTDLLGTPLLQTDANAQLWWRAEYEPFGAVYSLRSADQHQPLRLPGQEAEQLNLGANGTTERSYNVFRWYRPAWGRYTQGDPLGLAPSLNLYAYVGDNPATYSDPSGLMRVDPSCLDCPCMRRIFKAVSDFNKFFTPGWGTRNPKCRSALLAMGKKFKAPDGKAPIDCMANTTKDMIVKCAVGGTNCGGPPNLLSIDFKVVWIQPPACGGICGSAVNTVFHEALHNCGAPDESDPAGSTARDIADTCVGK